MNCLLLTIGDREKLKWDTSDGGHRLRNGISGPENTIPTSRHRSDTMAD